MLFQEIRDTERGIRLGTLASPFRAAGSEITFTKTDMLPVTRIGSERVDMRPASTSAITIRQGRVILDEIDMLRASYDTVRGIERSMGPLDVIEQDVSRAVLLVCRFVGHFSIPAHVSESGLGELIDALEDHVPGFEPDPFEWIMAAHFGITERTVHPVASLRLEVAETQVQQDRPRRAVNLEG